MDNRATVLENTSRREKPKQDKNKTQWAKFTYTGKETRAITKAFQNTNLRIAYSTNNTIGKLLTTRHQQPNCKYDKCGIYNITCPTCNMNTPGKWVTNLKCGLKNISEILNMATGNIVPRNT
jgi:hypothetical protein